MGTWSSMVKTKAFDILEQVESGQGLPVLSPVAIKLVELASDDTSSAQDLVDVIEKDPPLVSRLLRLANSSFYHASIPISTPTQAVIRIGFDRLRVMALSLSLRDTFPMGKIGPLDYEKFWRTSLYRAFISKSLASVTDCANPEEAFVAGLLMEIGLLLFFDLFIKGKEEEITLDLTSLQDLLERERALFGVDHRQIGKAALTSWKFPATIIACQELPLPDPLPTGIVSLPQVCHFAATLVQQCFSQPSGFPLLFQQAKQELGLRQDIVNEMLLLAFQEVEETATQFNLESQQGRDLILLLEKANRTLSDISERISAGTFSPTVHHFPSLSTIPAHDRAIQFTLQAIAHEIRNPLTAVGGFARKLAGTLDPASEEGRYVHLILSEAERLENVLVQVTAAASDP